jgi:hypothetical protein
MMASRRCFGGCDEFDIIGWSGMMRVDLDGDAVMRLHELRRNFGTREIKVGVCGIGRPSSTNFKVETHSRSKLGKQLVA